MSKSSTNPNCNRKITSDHFWWKGLGLELSRLLYPSATIVSTDAKTNGSSFRKKHSLFGSRCSKPDTVVITHISTWLRWGCGVFLFVWLVGWVFFFQILWTLRNILKKKKEKGWSPVQVRCFKIHLCSFLRGSDLPQAYTTSPRTNVQPSGSFCCVWLTVICWLFQINM